MSKKMWNKIFKTKSSKSSKTLIAANKINKRCSIYEEYQQLNALMNCDKQQAPQQQHEQQQEKSKVTNSNLKEIPTKPISTETPVCKSPITTPSSIDDIPLPAILAATVAAAKQQSTFAKVVNTLTLKRNLQNPPKAIKDDTGNGNAKTSKTKPNKSESTTITTTPTFKLKERLTATTSISSSMQILIVINKIACNAAVVEEAAADVDMADQAQLSVTKPCNDDTNQNVLHVEKYNSNIIAADEPEPNVSTQLTPCPICSRTFNPATLKKHVGICEKMAAKKRNIFDSSRQRREGTELAAYPLPKNYGLPATGGKHERGHSPKPHEVGSPILARKKPAEDFARATMRTSMRKRSNSTNNAPHSTPVSNSTTTHVAASGGSNFQRDRMRSSERSFAKRIQPPPAEQCPHCERCFGVKAYDRHVEWCREKALQASIKQNMRTEQNVAKERLEARTKYRAPCLKTKRSINRDKYSGFAGDENEMTESTKLANSNNNNIMSLSMTSSMTSERMNAINKPDNGALTTKKRNSIELTGSHIAQGVNFDNCKEFRLTSDQVTPPGTKKSQDVANVQLESAAQELSLPSLMAVQRKLNKTYDDAIQDHSNEPQANDSNDLSTALTLSSITAIPKLGTSKSTAALATRRKLKTKEKLLINLKTPMVSAQAVKAIAADDALGTLMASVSLPQIQIHQRQAIFEMSTTEAATASKRGTVAATTTTTPAPTTAMHTKLETNPIKSPAICRPKRKKCVRQPNANYATPLKAIPLLKESIELFGMPARVLDDKEIKVIKAPPTPPQPPLARNRSFILSGLPDKYDPFLSAKRQLEDLCSPSSANDPLEALKSPKTPNLPRPQQSQTPSTPSTPSILPTKMTTSLTLSTATPLTPNNSQNRATPNFSTATKASNFRRTSSLRGPRRSPLLPSRPLFAQKHRPTIQRGLSDEGPISTNFLKPEEYDEMPVRSVCVNDFAITNSPRVIRRDTSSSNRKNNLKLNISPAANTANANSSDERLANTASKYLSKTDSLAVFLKYENELEKLNPTNIVAAPLPSTQSTATKPIEQTVSVPSSPAQNLNSPVITKELKDKSNTLSKQNSAKSIKTLETPESPKINDEQQQPKSAAPLLIPLVNPSTTPVSNQINNENISHNTKFAQLRLEPISKPGTPLSKPSTPQSKTNLSSYSAKNVLPMVATKLPAVNLNQPVNLNAIFGDSTKPQANTINLSFNKERKNSSSSEYIDPKLINKCDNLTVNLTSVRTQKHSDSDSSAHRNDSSTSSTSSSVESSVPKCAPISQLSKLMPLSKVDSPAAVHKQSPNQTNNNHSAVIQPPAAHPIPNPTQRNSTEGRNLLKRKMRLGRNQFLYDASPEADSCSADDEANRSSVEYDEQQFNPALFGSAQTHHHQHQTPRPLQTPQNSSRLHTPPTIPPLPIFDDFDFEEFLSSFENDEEQFPLFKDCREFLMNRTSNKQRSTLTPNSNFTNTNNNQSQQQSPHQYQSPKPTSPFPHHTHHFQFPNLTPKNSQLLTPSTLRSNSNLSMRKESSSHPMQMQYNELKSPSSHNTFSDETDLNKKREIFISIETEQNDLGRSPISPNSIRNMVGNPSAVVEVEVDAKDNKFTKLSDDEPLAPMATSSQLNMPAPFMNAHNLPNVQLNNAKNLIQKMQDDFRQMSEEVSVNIRQAVESNQGQQANAKLLYGDSAAAVRPATTPSAAACADSDDMSSLDGYPISSQSSRRGVGSKLSADSAYGSLSRQRSSELSTHRNLSRTRPSTANSATNTSMQSTMMDASTQHQQLPLEQQQQQQHYKYSTMKSRGRQMSGGSSSSSSSSDNSLPPIVSHNNLSNSSYQQQLSQLYNPNNNNNNGRYEINMYHHHSNNNNNNCETPLSSPIATQAPTISSSVTALGASNNSSSNALSHSSSTSNTAMSASMKLSKFCHECGGKFLIDQAKFCMDCGVRRIVL